MVKTENNQDSDSLNLLQNSNNWEWGYRLTLEMDYLMGTVPVSPDRNPGKTTGGLVSIEFLFLLSFSLREGMKGWTD